MLEIFSPAGSLLYSTPINTGCKRKISLMTEDYISVKFSDKNRIDFPIGSHIGDFYITEEQSCKQNANTGAYDYELRFNAFYYLWANKQLRYIAPGVTDDAYETSFKLTASIDIHCGVIQRALTELGFTYDGSPFRFEIKGDLGQQDAKYIHYNNLSILDGIAAIAEAYECEWWVKEGAVYLGKCSDDGNYEFEVGKNVSSISSSGRNTNPNRIFVFGSDRNLPSDYRRVTEQDTINAIASKRLMLPPGIPYLQTKGFIPENEIVEGVVVFDYIYPKTSLSVESVFTYQDDQTKDEEEEEKEEGIVEDKTDDEEESSTQNFYRITYGDKFLFSKDYILSGEELHIIFESGLLNGLDFAVNFNPLGEPEKNTDGSWNPKAQMLEIIVNSDFGRELPDDVLFPQEGDRFILYNWDSSQMKGLGLIEEAERNLLNEGYRQLEEYSKDTLTYTCSMMWDWCKERVKKHDSPTLGSSVILRFNKDDSGRPSRIIGIEYDLDIEYSNVTYICGESVSASRLKKLENKVEGLIQTGTNVRVQNSLDFLSKRYSDSTPFSLSIGGQLKSMNFRHGLIPGDGLGWSFYRDANGMATGELDNLIIRGEMFVNTLTINQIKAIGGMNLYSIASIEVSEVEEYDDRYRCYFEIDERYIANLFAVDDIAYSHHFDPKNDNLNMGDALKFYRRRVIGIGENYIDLTKGYAPRQINTSSGVVTDTGVLGSGVPAKGDVIAQFGNYTDKRRQFVIIMDVHDGAYMRYLGDLDWVGVAGKEYGYQGYQSADGVRWFIGDKPIEQYAEFVNGKLNIAGCILMKGSSFVDEEGNQTPIEIYLRNYIKDNIPDFNLTKEDIEDFVWQIVGGDLKFLQDQLDGKIETWFGEGEPTMEKDRYPLSEWHEDGKSWDDIFKEHAGDLYYDAKGGGAYRFMQDPGTKEWFWDFITDEAIAEALAKAKEAWDLADNKRRVFYGEFDADKIKPPYDEGDVWMNAIFPKGNGGKGTDDENGIYDNDILRCIRKKEKGESFDIKDWTLASKYTDDTALNLFIDEYRNQIKDIEEQLDQKAETWYQGVDPSQEERPLGWKGEDDEMHEGDLWYCTKDIPGTKYTKGSTWMWTDKGWEFKEVPDSLFDVIDGKSDIFVLKPEHGYHINDLWFLDAESAGKYRFLGNKEYKEGTLLVAVASRDRWSDAESPSHWTKKDRYIDDIDLEEWGEEYGNKLKEIISQQMDGKAETWYQGTDPSKGTRKEGTGWLPEESKEHIGDLWYCTENIDNDFTKGTTWYYTGEKWVSMPIPQEVFDKIDGKASVYIEQPKPPYYERDLWVNAVFKDDTHDFQNEILKCIRTREEGDFSIDDWSLASEYAHRFDYLSQSLEDATKEDGFVKGGLILTSHIRLGMRNRSTNEWECWSGISGLVYPDMYGYGIAAWYGGDPIDMAHPQSNLPANPRYAQTLFRFDGSGYLAGNRIGWEKDGSGWLANKEKGIRWDEGGNLFLNNGIILEGGEEMKTLGSIVTFLNNFSINFKPVRINGTTVTKLQWQDVRSYDDFDAVVSEKGFYSESFISARGVNPNAGTSGGGNTGGGNTGNGSGGSSYLYSLLDVDSSVQNAPTGKVLMKSGNMWVAGDAGLNPTELADYLTRNSYATQQWVNSQGFLKSTSWDDVTGKPSWIGSTKPSYSWSEINNKPGWIGSTKPSYNWSEISNRPTTIAGYGITDAYTKTEVNNTFVKKAGDTMTGTLYFNNVVNAIQIYGGNYGVIFRRSEDHFHIIPTAYGDLTGNIGTLRPLSINLATGLVSMENGLKIGGATLRWDSSHKCLIIDTGFASESFISAKGVNSGASGGSGGGYGQYLILQRNGVEIGRYNGSTQQTINISVPTDYVTSSQLDNVLRWGITGVVEGGRYYDFHSANYGTNNAEDYTVRLDGGLSAISRTFTFPAAGGVFATQAWVEGMGYLTLSSAHSNFVSALGTNGNYLTWTKNGTVNNLTVPYATNADTLDGYHYTGFMRGNQRLDAGTNIDTRATNYAEVYEVLNPGGNAPFSGWSQIMNIGSRDGLYGYQLANHYDTMDVLKYRAKIAGTWQGWRTIIDSSNIGSQSVNYATSAATAKSSDYSEEADMAKSLKTTRTLWGRDFDGTQNVSGAISNAGTITPSASNTYSLGSSSAVWNYVYGRYITSSTNLYLSSLSTSYSIYFRGGTTTWMTLNATGLGLGTTNPEQKFHVVGDIRCYSLQSSVKLEFYKSNANSYYLETNSAGQLNFCASTNGSFVQTRASLTWDGVFWAKTGIYSNGYVSAKGNGGNSDERLKTDFKPLNLTLAQIANAPSVFFKWKDDGSDDFGSIAQYWQKINPLFARKNYNGNLTLDYGKLAMTGLINVTGEIVNVINEINTEKGKRAELERQVNDLKAQVEELKAQLREAR